jgi:NADH-quinone oxidoreductase subunit N
LAVAPLHWFTIDAYQSAPTSISMFLMTVPKIALLTIIYRIFSQFNLGIISIIVILMILSTFLFLSIQALGQLKLKRFIIFTMTINNVIFLAPLLLNHSENSFSIFTLLLCYFLPFSLTFYCLSLLPKSQEKIENLFFIKNPVLILSFLVSAVSFSGIPVFAGFLVKYLVYSQLLSFHELTVLLPIVILSLLPIYYYIRLVQATFFTQVVEPSYSFIMPTFVPKESATQTTVLSSLVVLNLIIITIQIIPSFW